MKKVWKILKSKQLLVLVILIAAPVIGAGVAYLTTGKGHAANVTAVAPSESNPANPLYGNKNSGDSLTSSNAVADSSIPSATTGTQNTTQKPKSTAHSSNKTPPVCNKTQLPAYIAAINQYNGAMAAETSLHYNWVNPIDQSTDPAGYQSAIDAENARHDTAVTNIQQTYDTAIATISCS